MAIVATDLPAWMRSRSCSALVAGLGAHDVAVAGGERPEPLCAVWRVSACAAAATAAFAQGERAVHRALAALDLVVVPVPVQHAAQRQPSR